MRKVIFTLLAVILVVVGQATTASGDSVHPNRIVGTQPADGTPHVLDGRVWSVAKVGNTIVLGGNFSQARNDGSTTSVGRANLLAFNATTGRLSTSFVPNPNGTVYSVIPAGDGASVYVGGNFSSVNGASSSRVVRLDVSSGNEVAGFNAPGMNGQVRALDRAGNRLWVGGKFTHVGGAAQKALATLNATTGARDSYMNLTLAGQQNGGVTNVLRLDINDQEDRLAAVGNFKTVDNAPASQILMLDIDGSSVERADWNTSFYAGNCSRSFNTYMTDVGFSPDGSFLAVSTTGAYGGSKSACDTVSRFETYSTGSDIQPSWTAYTGGDTTWSVEVTDDVVYVGGHQRWQNNPFAGDRPGQGAVSRPGIAALDPLNGLPYQWNPTRTRGVGVFDMLPTPEGLYVASNTDRIGNWQYRGRIALMPLATGKTLTRYAAPELPGDIYRVPSGSSQLTQRAYDGTTMGTLANAPIGTVPWGQVVGGFVLDGTLYTAYSNGSLTKQSFDGTTYGEATPVETSDLLVRMSNWHDGDVPRITGLFYERGRIYFTRSDSSQLHYRYFNPESDVVGADRFIASNNVPGINFSQTRGMFLASDHLYWGTPSGTLFRMDWTNGPASGSPSAGTATAVSGPGIDGIDWSSRALFFREDEPPPPNEPPVADFNVNCDELACSMDASSSLDPDGSIASYAWDLGDGSTATGVTASHTYAEPGLRTVSLTVTDDRGEAATTTRSIHPNQNAVAFVGAEASNGNRRHHETQIPSGVQPGDRLLLYFTGNVEQPNISPPNGWSLLEQAETRKVTSRVWTRLATAGDGGSDVVVTTGAYTKSTVTVAAYRGSTTGPLTATASATDDSPANSHTTPQVQATNSGGWLVSYWADKSSTDRSWTPPAGETQRAQANGSGGGHVNSILTDGDSGTSNGTLGGLTAVSTADARAAMFSIVLPLAQ